MKYLEILKKNQQLGQLLAEQNQYHISVYSNLVVEQIKDFIELVLRQEGINAKVVFGGYDSIVQDSIQQASQSNAVIIFWEVANMLANLDTKVGLLTRSEWSALIDKIEKEIDIALSNLRKTPLVLINRFSCIWFDADHIRDSELKRFCKHLNTVLDKKVSTNQLIIDLDFILAQIGLNTAIDLRQYQSSKAPYSNDFYQAYAQAVAPAFLAATGRSKKVLVLDCDNTLWGGVVGEDGEKGIQIDSFTAKGKIFCEVQYLLKGFIKEGILLALCSKNNKVDVDVALASHPTMILRMDDFVAKRINWNDKASNLREIAKELNLGLDSFVFVDDSSFELGLINKELPQVKCVQVPTNLSEYPSIIRSIKKDFFMISRTMEDEIKTELYIQEKKRQEQRSQFFSIEDYLASLGLVITLFWNRDIPVARAAQMTQKTNQFNLTTRRYTETDIEQIINDPGYMVAVFSVSDHYGDYGITGMTIVEFKDQENKLARIDTLLMSCRVIGRNIEYTFFDQIIKKLIERGFTDIEGEYWPTAKNSQVADFYANLGFKLISSDDKYQRYSCNLSTYRFKNLQYVSINKG